MLPALRLSFGISTRNNLSRLYRKTNSQFLMHWFCRAHREREKKRNERKNFEWNWELNTLVNCMLAHWPPPPPRHRQFIPPHYCQYTTRRRRRYRSCRVSCASSPSSYEHEKKNAEKHFVRRKKSLAGKICWEQKNFFAFACSHCFIVFVIIGEEGGGKHSTQTTTFLPRVVQRGGLKLPH